MICTVTERNISIAARIHATSWQESHKHFCSAEFVAAHTPQHQAAYLRKKMGQGSKIFLLEAPEPVGIVSVTGGLIEDLYVLPEKQNCGYGTALLEYAINQCSGVPSLWVLENNIGAARLYKRMGFYPSGREHIIPGKMAEIEYTL